MRLLPLFSKPRNDEFWGILVWEFRLGILDWNSSLGILIWNSRIPNSRSRLGFAVAVKIRLQGCEVNLASFCARLAVAVKIKGAAR